LPIPTFVFLILVVTLIACGGQVPADSTGTQAPTVTSEEVIQAPTGTPAAGLTPVTTPNPSPTSRPPASQQPSAQVFTDSRSDYLWSQATEPPDFSKVSLTWLENGFTEVRGIAGAIPGSFPVYVASPNTGNATLTQAASDGSFSAQVVALPGSWVLVKYDPTYGKLLPADILEDPRPARVNAAPGGLAQVPTEVSSVDGVPFTISGTALPDHIDFTLDGSMVGDLSPGGSVVVSGTATVYVTPDAVVDMTGRRLNLNVFLVPIFDAGGRARMVADQFFSNILTPTGLPVEHWMGPTFGGDSTESGGLTPAGTANKLSATFSLSVPIPSDAPAGVYSLWLDTLDSDSLIGSLGGARPEVNPFLTNHALAFPPFVLGTPAASHLVWTLLTDVISADGSRGVVAAEDAADFQISNRIATQSHQFVIPRKSKSTGQAITYRLEPYLPMVAHGDRYIPNVPNPAFKFPSGALSLEITRPGGEVDIVGPAPFNSAATRTPASSGGVPLDNGGGHLAEVFQLSTGSGLFDYQFPAYGEYTIRMTGFVEDIYGNSYDGGGVYTVFVAEPLDIEPAVLPFTPMEVGDFFNPGVTLLPGVPADVEVKVTLLVESDPGQRVDYLVTGKANRFGAFTPPLGSPRIEMTGEGEFLVETSARYTDPAGVLWMAATRWGQVVASSDTTLLAHGRRGRDDTPSSEVKLWFNDPADLESGAHVNLPYATGDILWQTEDDSARVIITVQDTEGRVEEAIKAWDGLGKYHTQGDHAEPIPSLDDRARLNELPLGFATAKGFNAALTPEDIVSYGYWYGGVERPGERVREIVSDDDIGTAYWRFGELYGLQPGMGVAGDLPNDFKFQFGGAVFRDTTRALNRYGIYGSLWVHLPENDSIGSRVFPPFQGANGGSDGGPIMTLDGKEIDAFVVPLAVRPGTILETGDTFSFSAHMAPTLPAGVGVSITGPSGFVKTIDGRANAIGYYYDPSQDFQVTVPGVYHVAVTATFDSPTSAGPMSRPYPTGTVLGAVDGGFDLYVVVPDSAGIQTPHPGFSVVKGVTAVPLIVETSGLDSAATVHYTIGMPGFLLEAGTSALTDGWTTITYDPLRLSQTFPNIDTKSSKTFYFPSGLVDTVWVNALLESEDGGFQARQFTLQGPDLYALDGQ